MARNPNAVRRAPRLMQSQVVLGKEPDAFSPSSAADQEGLASLAYLSGVGDSNASVSSFIGGFSNSVYSEFMNSVMGNRR
jgi:hypothetical protein